MAMTVVRGTIFLAVVAGLSACSKHWTEADLFDATRSGDTGRLRKALDAGVSANAVEDGWTPLHVILDISQSTASDSVRLEIVDLLLKHGADPNKKGGVHTTGPPPLHFAVVYGPKGAVEKLVSAGADVNAEDNYGATPLGLAVQISHLEVVRLLLLSGANPNLATSKALNSKGMAALHLAARGQATVDKDMNDHYESTPDQPEIIRALLEAGADPTLRDANGHTAIELAQMNKQDAAVEVLSSFHSK